VNPRKMYQKAVNEGVLFYQFYEWIQVHLKKQKYNLDFEEDFLPTSRRKNPF
jgi:hypothetical protein